MKNLCWSYKTQDSSIRHIGPTAQDFYKGFGFSEDELPISTIDADGIALYKLSLEKDQQIEELKTANDELSKRVEKLEKLVAELMKK
jgi:hypothetical protein